MNVNAGWEVYAENPVKHIHDLLSTYAQVNDWRSSLNNLLTIDEKLSVQGDIVYGNDFLIVSERSVTMEPMDIGGQHKANETQMTIDIISADKKDFHVLRRKVKSFIWHYSSIGSNIASGEWTKEWRWRLILNTETDISDNTDRIFRAVIDFEMKSLVTR